MHIEEDAGKNTHTGSHSYVDLNRQGTPLIEIVSKADIASPEEAVAYLEALRQRIQFTGISDVKMEEGSMRVDTNISVRPYGSDQYGTKTEMKNINSFNFVKNALNFEADRHQKVLMAGGEIVQETRRYDEATKGRWRCGPRKVLTTTVTSRNRTYRRWKLMTPGLKKFGPKCQKCRANAGAVTLTTSA